MLKRDKVAYSELPSALAATIPESLFLKAYDNAESKTVVAWCLDSRTNKQREIEFSRKLGRLLSRSERERNFPAEREVVLRDSGVKVHIANRLEPDTDVRYETYVAFDPVTSAQLAKAEQIFFAPFVQDPDDVIRPAIQKANFPAVYAGWTAIDKIRYWVGVLYRLRRQTGEGGRNEDEAFSPALLVRMRAVDPGIDGILATILAELGRMEMTGPDVMRAAFNQRTGASI
ncbi:hypothetical protein WJ78_04445 [Burkholderia ubonensis]|uniref:Uncharacterized protein n=1 Tax=Burkholderia ubonensis TaxID=101571 RepID=A0ABD6Q2J0_9BURK|nr:hypothetical protein [Burkholderia ubonensis]KVM82996.1 hypothetical protein WJ60_23240 [Burkholderia ubonensis]KVO73410.1 hypothetical protein WJ78_04445 [Burkholderia ubonensis]KVP84130.1 hypothetical protein WJ97_33960 [Burkholderia ubonensis]KVQ96447.1 hypothetical protein WK10_19990 [Burkholderia ubonensis]KVT44672.1 hypothetical protein WK51_04095 [Burkholderia ubonensis]